MVRLSASPERDGCDEALTRQTSEALSKNTILEPVYACMWEQLGSAFGLFRDYAAR